MSNRKSSSQLYSLSPPLYEFPNYVDSGGKLHTLPAENLPFMIWPDGSWCGPANTYMRELLEKGLSRRNRGGSLAVAAAHISHLLRYCWKRRLDPIDLNDNQFREFIDEVRQETHVCDPNRKKRDANTVIAIGRTCLGFLDSVSRQSGDAGFIGPEGRIRTRMQKQTNRRFHKSTRSIKNWDHPTLPNPDPQKKRMPISTANIEDLRSAVAKTSTTSHQRVRRHTMLKLLEVTGARRGEIALITVESVFKAGSMEYPMLHVPTLKKPGGKSRYRYVPMGHADLAFVRQYAEVHRHSVMRRKYRGKPDHGLLLINGRTGEALKPNTITQEVRLLAIAAGIQEKACPHMFRYRFLTKLFVALIEQHSIENTDDFRRLLIDGEELKRKVAEWTDHTDLETLDRYIQLAFDEIGNFKKVYNLTSAGLALDSFVGTLDAELEAIITGEQPMLIIERMKTYVEKLKLDLSTAQD